MTSFILIPFGRIAYRIVTLGEFAILHFFRIVIIQNFRLCLGARIRMPRTWMKTHNRKTHINFACTGQDDTVAPTHAHSTPNARPTNRPTDRVQVFHAMHLNLLSYAINHDLTLEARGENMCVPFRTFFGRFFSYNSWLCHAFSQFELECTDRRHHDQFSTHEWNVKMHTMQMLNSTDKCKRIHSKQTRKVEEKKWFIFNWQMNWLKKNNLNSLSRWLDMIYFLSMFFFCPGIAVAFLLFLLNSYVCRNQTTSVLAVFYSPIFRCAITHNDTISKQRPSHTKQKIILFIEIRRSIKISK